MPEPPDAREPGREQAAHGCALVARIERALLSVLGEHRVERSERRAGTDRHRQVFGFVPQHARRCRDLDGGFDCVPDFELRTRCPSERRPAPTPPRRSTRVRSTCPPVPAAARRTGCRGAAPSSGFAAPSGSNASRSRACASRSSGANSSGMSSRFSIPTPCSPGEHATGRDARLEDLGAGVVHAIPDPVLAAVEQDQRVQVAVARVEHVHRDRAGARRRSRRRAASTSTRRVRGTTASWR